MKPKYILLIVLGSVLVVALLCVGWYKKTYDRFVSLDEGTKSAWAQVENQLQRRYDLVPNLVETGKAYAAHEQQTLEKVTQARNTAMNAVTTQGRAQAESALSGAVKSMFAIAEAYPELKADQNFTSLQQELTNTEGFIAACRSNYNDAVLTLNNALQVFPANLVAAVLKFQSRPFFGVPDSAAREPAKVQL